MGLELGFSNDACATGTHVHGIRPLLRDPHIASLVPVAGRVLGVEGDADRNAGAGCEEDFAEALEFFGGAADGGGFLGNV